MTRIVTGIVGIVSSIIVGLQLPAILSGWSILIWWTLIGVATVCAVNIVRGILDYDEAGEP